MNINWCLPLCYVPISMTPRAFWHSGANSLLESVWFTHTSCPFSLPSVMPFHPPGTLLPLLPPSLPKSVTFQGLILDPSISENSPETETRERRLLFREESGEEGGGPSPASDCTFIHSLNRSLSNILALGRHGTWVHCILASSHGLASWGSCPWCIWRLERYLNKLWGQLDFVA